VELVKRGGENLPMTTRDGGAPQGGQGLIRGKGEKWDYSLNRKELRGRGLGGNMGGVGDSDGISKNPVTQKRVDLKVKNTRGGAHAKLLTWSYRPTRRRATTPTLLILLNNSARERGAIKERETKIEMDSSGRGKPDGVVGAQRKSKKKKKEKRESPGCGINPDSTSERGKPEEA